MIKTIGLFFLSLVAIVGISITVATAQPVVTPPSFVPSSSDPIFTPLHLYYLSQTGNDANNGLTPATAWLTPNHSVKCGDVIIDATGNYARQFNTWGTSSDCPSTSGGIDSTGGIYFATMLCGGTFVGACNNTLTSSGNTFDINKSNWAVMGWSSTTPNTSGQSSSFFMDSCSVASTLHHVAFINNESINSGSSFLAGPCASTTSFDYWAVVGNIAERGNTDGPSVCGGSINPVSPQNFDTVAGTHIFIHGNGVWNSVGPGCSSNSDGEGVNLDSFDRLNYSQKTVLTNNIIYTSHTFGINIFYAGGGIGIQTPFNICNNTMYNNSINGFPVGGNYGGITFNGSTSPWATTLCKNIVQEPNSTNTGGGGVFALEVGNPQPNAVIGGTGVENILKGAHTSCRGSCDPGNNAVAFNGANVGINIYTNPLFTNVTDLINNQNGPPNCSSFQSVTQCMGYDPLTSTLTVPSIISDLQASCAGCSGKGYQLPNKTCAPNPDYPVWCKGICGGLYWDGVNVRVMRSLITVPCGL